MPKIFGNFFKEKAKTFDHSRPQEIRLKPKAKSNKSTKKENSLSVKQETEMLPSHLLDVYRTPFKPIGHRPEDYISDPRRSIFPVAKTLPELKRSLRNGIGSAHRARTWRIVSQYLPYFSTNEDAILTKKRLEYQGYTLRYFEADFLRGNDDIHKDTLKLIKKDVMRTLPESRSFRNVNIQAALSRLLFVFAAR